MHDLRLDNVDVEIVVVFGDVQIINQLLLEILNKININAEIFESKFNRLKLVSCKIDSFPICISSRKELEKIKNFQVINISVFKIPLILKLLQSVLDNLMLHLRDSVISVLESVSQVWLPNLSYLEALVFDIVHDLHVSIFTHNFFI